jgi:hypothetical protein
MPVKIDIEALISKRRRESDAQAARQQVSTYGRAPIYGWLYDSGGRVYRVLYRVIETSTDGTGPVVPSNQPKSMRETPGYPSAFQARSLERRAEVQKIDRIARDLDPIRMLAPHVDPTIGAPVTWLSHGEEGTRSGRSYVLGGNGRTIALMRASQEAYREYEELGRLMWPDIWPDKPARPEMRHLLVRQVYPRGCIRREMDPLQSEPDCRLEFEDAVRLAGATQASLSARETPLGEALSLVRSLGFDPTNIARNMPPFSWDQSIARDNIEDFIAEPGNQGLVRWLRELMPATWQSWTGDLDNATRLFQSMMIGFLPRSVLMEGFSSEREEAAVMAALPFLAQISIDVNRGDLGREWDLLPDLVDAKSLLNKLRGKGFRATMNEIDRMAHQQNLRMTTADGREIKTLAEEISENGILLALILKRGEEARDPSIPIEAVFKHYLAASKRSTGPRQGFFGGRPQPANTSLALGRALAESMRGPGADPIRVKTYQQVRSRGMF